MTPQPDPVALASGRPDGIHTAGTLPAGTYWLGDPAYAIEDADWQAFNRAAGDDDTGLHPLFDFKGAPAFAMPTLRGDGTFPSDLGLIPVDSGRICCVPERHVGFQHVQYGHFHTFDRPFQVRWAHGRFTFGAIAIDTA